MSSLPFVEVTRLASSCSLYAAALKPLGLRYLYTTDSPSPSTFYGRRGATQDSVVLEIREARAPKPSNLAISAPSVDAADDVFTLAVRANPETARQYLRHPQSESFSAEASGAAVRRIRGSGGDIRVRVTDYDGNVMDIIYRPPPEYPSHYDGSTVRHTQSTDEEASRILHWNYDVASSDNGEHHVDSAYPTRTATRRLARDEHDSRPPSLRRSLTTGASTYEPAASARKTSNGVSTSTVVGALLGVAAAGAAIGAGIHYGMSRRDQARAPRQECDPPPAFPRRSTCPDPYPGRELPQAGSHMGRLVEVDHTLEKVHYPGTYGAPRRPDFIARYSLPGSARSKEADDTYEDARSRHLKPRARASVRTRSEAPSNRAPYIEEADHDGGGGYVGLHHSRQHSRTADYPPMVRRGYTYDAPDRQGYAGAQDPHHSQTKPHIPVIQRSYTYDTPDHGSFVSAMSFQTSGTARPPPVVMPIPSSGSSQVITRSRTGNRVTTTTVKVSGSGDLSPRDARALSRAGTYLSARNMAMPASEQAVRHYQVSAGEMSTRLVPPPRSRSQNAQGRWDAEEEGGESDSDSIAPSDSISCVGSKRSGRERSYH